MKKTLFIIFAINIASTIFGLELDFKHVSSATKISSFSVYNSEFDRFTDPLYRIEDKVEGFYIYPGISENFLNTGFSFSKMDFYGAFTFFQETANYKDWPDNQTNLGLSVTGGYKNFTAQFRYSDFCYSEGRGYATPGLSFANVFFADSTFKLRTSLGCDLYNCYTKSNDTDVLVPKTTLKIDYSKDYTNGVGIEYTYLPFFKGAENSTDLSNVPNSHKIYVWYGISKPIDKKIEVGFRPTFLINLNAINPTQPYVTNPTVHNVIPKKNNTDFSLRFPIAVTYSFNETIDFMVSFLFGQYYASYSHLGYEGIGGSNKNGWVNENGIGFGVKIVPSSNCKIEIGSSFIRIREYKEGSENYDYSAKNISAGSLLDSPLAVSVELKF